MQTAGGGFALARVSQCGSEDREGDGGGCTARIVDGESEGLGKSKSNLITAPTFPAVLGGECTLLRRR